MEDGVTGAARRPPYNSATRRLLERFDDLSQVAFEIERLPDGRVAVLLPGAPEPWSGSAAVVDGDRVTPLDLEIIQVARMLKDFGRGTGAALAGR